MKDIFTTSDVAQLFQVYTTTVVDWIASGKLKAFQTPGGHYRIARKELLGLCHEKNIPVPPHLTGKKRILLVDDEKSILNLMNRVLSKAFPDCETQLAENGFEAGKLIAEFQPTMVVLDLQLPGLNGFEVCKNIRVSESMSHVKILAISGFNTQENKRKILAAGANDFLGKPFELKVFEQRVRALMDQ